jgi:hypothetical protein
VGFGDINRPDVAIFGDTLIAVARVVFATHERRAGESNCGNRDFRRATRFDDPELLQRNCGRI